MITYLVHASLSLDKRRRAKQAFVEARDCVIVSTSVLELGVDAGTWTGSFRLTHRLWSRPSCNARIAAAADPARRGTACSWPWTRMNFCMPLACSWPAPGLVLRARGHIAAIELP